MIPDHWQPHYREHDDELTGYLVPGAESGTAQPVTLFGYPLAENIDSTDAAELLDARGLSVLIERWYLHTGDADPVRVSIVEVTPEHVVVQGFDYGAIDFDVQRYEFDNPVPDGVLRLG